ncbi:MAG TPA: oligosaccharide flippase family protein [Planctomycetaceae bacterium]|nr:oligosaccharide flippase family protein [Planctomycetaceae bacterium]
MNGLVLLYGLVTGLSRGAALLYTPLLSGWLGLEDYGLFALVQTGSQVLVGLVSLNGGAAVLREGTADRKHGLAIFLQFSWAALLIGGTLALVSTPFDTTRCQWWTSLVLLGVLESLQNLGASWLRSRDADRWFIGMALFKSAATLGLILWARDQSWTLPQLLQGQIALGVVLAFAPLAAAGLLWLRQRTSAVAMPTFTSLLAYTLPLVPHAVGQWVIGGSSRFVIKWIDGDAAVGLYSLAYTAGMVVLILNTGLGMVLPQEIVRHYEDWKTGPRRRQLIGAYSVASLIVLGLAFAALELDRRWLHLTGCDDPTLPLMVGLIGTGLYCHGLYYIYGNFYFYHRATGQLAVQTIAAAIVNVALTLALVPILGPLGAAIATLVTYLAYLAFVILGLRKLEPRILSLVNQDAWLLVGPAMSMGLTGWAFMIYRGLTHA